MFEQIADKLNVVITEVNSHKRNLVPLWKEVKASNLCANKVPKFVARENYTIDNTICYTARRRDTNKLIGVVMFSPQIKKDFVLKYGLVNLINCDQNGTDVSYIQVLCSAGRDSKSQGVKGLGSFLLEGAMVKHGKENGTILVLGCELRNNKCLPNTQASNFYRQLGFNVVKNDPNGKYCDIMYRPGKLTEAQFKQHMRVFLPSDELVEAQRAEAELKRVLEDQKATILTLQEDIKKERNKAKQDKARGMVEILRSKSRALEKQREENKLVLREAEVRHNANIKEKEKELAYNHRKRIERLNSIQRVREAKLRAELKSVVRQAVAAAEAAHPAPAAPARPRPPGPSSNIYCGLKRRAPAGKRNGDRLECFRRGFGLGRARAAAAALA